MSYDKAYHRCPMCSNRLDPDPVSPVQHWDGKQLLVFSCTINCKSRIWVEPFKGIKEEATTKPPWWQVLKR